jgi:hypothetical protein
MAHHEGDEEERTFTLTQADLVAIAEQGAQQAFDKITTRLFVFVGKSLLERIFWILGLTCAGIYIFLKNNHLIS